MGIEQNEIKVDPHCHSIASRHALCTVTEIVTVAKSRGLSGVAITDHHPSLTHHGKDYWVESTDPIHFYVMGRRYVSTEPAVTVYSGIEMNILDHVPWLAGTEDDFLPFLRVRLAGIHVFPHLFKLGQSEKENTDAILRALAIGTHPIFHILTHPVYRDIPIDMEAVVSQCVERGVALEVNNSILSVKNHTYDRMARMLEIALKYKAPVSVSSDAHVPHEIGDFRYAIQLLNEMNYPLSLVVNRSVASFESFLKGFND